MENDKTKKQDIGRNFFSSTTAGFFTLSRPGAIDGIYRVAAGRKRGKEEGMKGRKKKNNSVGYDQ